jgi:hypothetical protein
MTKHHASNHARLSKKFVAVVAILSSIIVVSTALLFVSTKVERTFEMPMKVQVVTSGSMGFDLNQTIVTFGRTYPGGAVTRYFNITNTGDEDIKVVVKPEGKISDWLLVTPQTFIVTPTQGIGYFQVGCAVPRDAAAGNYSGTLRVYVMEP